VERQQNQRVGQADEQIDGQRHDANGQAQQALAGERRHHVRGVADSKVVIPVKRRKIYLKLRKHDYSVVYGSAADIDSQGIAVVIQNLIAQLMEQYQDGNTLFLIDGQFRRNFGRHSRKIIDGDALYYSIAAASILAKVERDALMVELGKQYPEYGLASNKGYMTPDHVAALGRLGPTSLHRFSFEPVRACCRPGQPVWTGYPQIGPQQGELFACL
jgi:ribonuclease HII